ncbi:MAG TPA: hypothetical protein VM840_00430, partial [Actinomycetota bacterium]|nr:hypothetical protein [Actinomycetota bacterium]
PGPHPMDGAGALAFARARYGMPGGDFGRSENHGRLLLDGLAKFRAETSGNPLRLMDWLNTFRDVVSTNVPPGELLRLSLLGRRMDPAAIRNVVLPGRPGTAGRESVVFLDPHAHTILASIRDDAVV